MQSKKWLAPVAVMAVVCVASLLIWLADRPEPVTAVQAGAGGAAAGPISGPTATAGAFPAATADATPSAQGSGLTPAMEESRSLRESAVSDDGALRSLIQRYWSERDPFRRESIKTVLSTIDRPEIKELARQLMASGEPDRRQDGVDILSRAPDHTPATIEALAGLLAAEQRPAVLIQALSALQPMPLEAATRDRVVDQIRSLATNADAGVRRQAILALGLWDRQPASTDIEVHALADGNADVRQASVDALVASGARDDATKAALLQLAANVAESKALRDSAVRALAPFKLNSSEAETVRQIQVQIRG